MTEGCGQKIGPYDCCTIITGDAKELAPAIPDESVDLIFTDPPFKLSQAYTANADADNLIAVSSIWPVAAQMSRIIKPGGYCMLFYDTRILPLALEVMRWAGWKYLRGLTFYRRWGNANKLYGWMSTSDFLLLFRKPSDEPYQFYSKDWRHDTYLKSGPEPEAMGHLAQKPIDCVSHIVGHLADSGALIVDPYVGTGTTAVAAKMLRRHYLAFEIDPDVAERARERVRNTQPPLFVVQPEQMAMQDAD